MYVCVFVLRVHVCVCVCMGAHACRDQGSTSGVIPRVPQTLFFEAVFYLPVTHQVG